VKKKSNEVSGLGITKKSIIYKYKERLIKIVIELLAY